MLLMLKVLMSLGFVAFDYLAYGPDKAVCVTNILPYFATCIWPPLCIKLISIPCQPPLPCRLQAPAWLEIGQSGL